MLQCPNQNTITQICKFYIYTPQFTSYSFIITCWYNIKPCYLSNCEGKEEGIEINLLRHWKGTQQEHKGEALKYLNSYNCKKEINSKLTK